MASSSGAVPTAEPAASTPIPVANPATSPTLDPTLCCSGTDYSKINYYNCESGVLPLAPISTCATCVAYQCIDWTLGSAANAAREADYFAQTGDSVYFGVGSYSNRTSYAGLCLRVSSASIDRDLIVQIVDQGYGLDSGNINLQVGDGGFGGTDACTIESTTMPQFAGPGTNWGVSFSCTSVDSKLFSISSAHRISMAVLQLEQRALVFPLIHSAGLLHRIVWWISANSPSITASA